MSLWDKVKQRASEPSTWAGIALATQGAAQVFKLDHGQQVADAVAQTGQAVAAGGGDWKIGAMTLLFGLISVFQREKGKK